MDPGEHAAACKFTIGDRGGQFTTNFDAAPADTDIYVLKSPPAAPTTNAAYEHMTSTLRRELPDRTLTLTLNFTANRSRASAR
jgi:putative transposase